MPERPVAGLRSQRWHAGTEMAISSDLAMMIVRAGEMLLALRGEKPAPQPATAAY